MPFKKMKFRSRLVASYLFLVTVPLLSLAMIFYHISVNRMTDMASKHALEIVRKTNELADLKFNKVKERSLGLVTDKALFEILHNLDPASKYEIVQADRKLTDLLRKYFLDNEDLFSFQMVTSYFTFGTSGLQGNANGTKLYTEAVDAGGKLVWVPTYDFADMYGNKELQIISLQERLMFSAVMQLRSVYLENGVSYSLDPSVERPVLIVTYKTEYFKKLFDNSIPLEGTSYMVVSPKGDVIAHPDLERLAAKAGEPWVRDVLAKKSGTEKVSIDGKDTIICFDTSGVTGWTSIVMIPSGQLIKGIPPAIRDSVIFIGVVLFIVSFILAFFISGQIVRPMKKLLSAIKRVGTGNFESRIAPDADNEFGIVFSKFNEMNERIQALIQENYESKIREKEAEIMALNAQLNPHFLYNTLNIMNWIAIENEQKQLSKMLVSLSNMLHYTTQNYKETGDLQEEIEWLKNYLYIMGERFEGKFTASFDISGEMYGYRVPRLFLHPIVENAILHGLGSVTEGGIIRIRGYMENGIRWFTVEDNGRGMDEELLESIMRPGSDHVGLKNVDARIRLLYGPDYGLRLVSAIGGGTKVIVRLPAQLPK